MGEWLHRKLQRQVTGRTAESGGILQPAGGAGLDRGLALPLQYSTSPQCLGLPAAGARSYDGVSTPPHGPGTNMTGGTCSWGRSKAKCSAGSTDDITPVGEINEGQL